MRLFLKASFIGFCVSGFAFTAFPARAQIKAPPATPSDAVVAYAEVVRCRNSCDCWYGVFPGQVNYCIGMRMWTKGSYRGGLELLKLSAGWGDKQAQYTLGMIYFNGDHVAQDRALGIAWLMLANERHNDAQTDLVSRSAAHLATPEQNKRAQRLFQDMRKKYGDKVAGARAWSHLRNYVKGAKPMAQTTCITDGGDSVPWSHGMAADPHVLCMLPGSAAKKVAGIANTYFQGMTGTVSVGPLQQVPGTEPSSTP